MKEYNKNEESEELFYINREKRIKQLLSVIGYDTEEDWNLYIEALSNSKRGYSIILQRDIDEVFVNSFNPEWILAWQGNIDLQICLDFFAVITYITDYFTKDDTGTMDILIEALKNSDCTSLKEKMLLLMNTFITHRQMGEAEAVYKIFPDFSSKNQIYQLFFCQIALKKKEANSYSELTTNLNMLIFLKLRLKTEKGTSLKTMI